MKILVSGASGLVGKPLVSALKSAGHDVTTLVREKSRVSLGSLYWSPQSGEIDLGAIDRCDAIVNLAGESIADGRWTSAKKQRIHDSRVQSTQTIASALARCPGRPRTLINASAVGYYGNRDGQWLDESSAAGDDFLAGVCRDWEAATRPAADSGVRVALARFGVILSGAGGALKKMLLPFRLGLGGKIGSGRQFISWIALDDVIAGLIHCLGNPAMSGPVNFVAPEDVTNAQYTKTLGRVLGRPTLFPMPAFAARLAFGQMADQLLLASQRAQPKRLLACGYSFKFPKLDAALRHVLA